MACPPQLPQAWSCAGSWEHLLLSAFCLKPLKDLSAKSSMESGPAVFKELPGGFEPGRRRLNLISYDGLQVGSAVWAKES